MFDDAQEILRGILADASLGARAAYGFFPANSVGDDIEVYADKSRSGLRTTLHALRQQADKGNSGANQALADFVAPRASGLLDWIGAFAVTTGQGADELTAAYEKKNDDYGSIMVKALADRLAEALAEWLHERARKDWGYGGDEDLSVEDLVREKYRGIRPAPGYPSCPDHTEKEPLFELLGGEEAVGISLTESFADAPGSFGVRVLFRPPRGSLLLSRKDRARPGPRLSQAQGDGPQNGGALAGAQPELRAGGGG